MSKPGKEALEALDYCFRELANADGSAEEVRKKLGPSDPFQGVSRRPPKPFQPEVLERLRGWLNLLADKAHGTGRDATRARAAYRVLLQGWLALHDIDWPSKDVFEVDLRTGSAGRPPDPIVARVRHECWLLRRQDKSDEEIARIVFPEECMNPVATQVAKRKVRDHLKKREHSTNLSHLLEEIKDLLGIEEPSFDDF